MAADHFAYIWTYRVLPQNEDEFCRLYGHDGEWVRLFRRASGYLDTTLYNDRDDSERYFTIDRWMSEEAYRRFRIEFADEFERLDGLGEKLTQEEIKLGEFGYRYLSDSG